MREGDLYQGESTVIAKLISSPLKGEWLSYTKMEELDKSAFAKEGYLRISAKKRYIDPFVGDKRLSEIDEDFASDVKNYLSQSFDIYLRSKN